MMTKQFRYVRWTVLGAVLSAAAMLFLGAVTSADQGGHERVYRVKITNLTKAQIFSPALAATHRGRNVMFKLGQASSEELADLAENGMNGALAGLLGGLHNVADVVGADGPILPGESQVFEIRSKHRFGRFSVAGMLVGTNDAFYAINGNSLPARKGAKTSWTAVGYDAGSEGNNEDCGFVPGPPCGPDSGNARDTEGAEGFVHVHNGIHGIGDIRPAGYDWRNPVAQIIVKRVR